MLTNVEIKAYITESEIHKPDFRFISLVLFLVQESSIIQEDRPHQPGHLPVISVGEYFQSHPDNTYVLMHEFYSQANQPYHFHLPHTLTGR
jgi:hypothetical protein